MASIATKPSRTDKTAKPVSAADRIKAPRSKMSNGITIKQVDKAIRDVMAKRAVQSQS